MFAQNELPILGILRGIADKDILPLVDICKKVGVKYLEVTMNTKGACQLIRKLGSIAGNELKIGAGTILCNAELKDALESGAKFIVTPAVIEEVIVSCVEHGIPVFPGALTPTEVHKAWDMGATMVKLFPSGLLGPAYIKMLKGPFDKIKIIAVGGVDEKNITEYFRQGADAVAFGAGIVRPEWLNKNRYDLIEEHLSSFILAYKGLISA